MNRAAYRIACVFATSLAAAALGADLAPEIVKKIQDAAPEKAYAKPQHPRRLLVFTLTRGFRHESIPAGVAAMRALAEKTRAFEVEHSEDPAMFEPSSLAQFDAVCLLNTTGELFMTPDFDTLPQEQQAAALQRDALRKEALRDFVEGGKGLAGIHAATDTLYQWEWYGSTIGGYFDGHPWHEQVGVKVEEPSHPVNAACRDGDFTIVDEIYQLKSPYARDKLRVLLSLDCSKTDMKKDGVHRADGDFAISWVRMQGRGRVYYCSLGHRDEIYWNPKVLRHYLAGIQFALGDLAADATPRGK